MALSPYPHLDDIIGQDPHPRRLTTKWQQWLNQLRDAVLESATAATVTALNAAYQAADAALSALITALDAALTALTARVTALETEWADATVDASYFASASGSWTVTVATDLIAYRYRRIGNTLQFAVRVNASSIGSTPTQLYLYLPDGMTISEYATGVFWHANFTTAVDAAGLWFASPGLRYLVLTRNAGATAFGNATDQFFVYLSGQCEVTP